ncbi:MAG: hypothetical protein NZL93_07180, partial [Chthoniobacterales bacterium]|nr:hypothetical protein [Chthoniobacterales bacterium]
EGSEMVLIDGVGTQVEGMKMHARFRLGSGGLFDLCYRRGENVFLKDLRDQNFLRHLPIWFREGVELGGFLLVTKKLTEGYGLLIMMGWKEGAFLIQSKEIHGIIDRMVNLYLQNQYGCEGE